MKHVGSSHIGQIVKTATLANPNAVGNNAGRTGAVVSQADTNRVATWLATQRPYDMDKAAVSRASSHGVGLRVKYEHRFPSGPNGEYMPSYQIAISCEVSPSGDHAAALADLRNFQTSAPIRKIEEWLAELSVIVARRQDDAFADELRVSVYSARLSRFPADVVRSVLIDQTYKFWPTWEELEKRCIVQTAPRIQMIAALERGPVPDEPKRREPTAEERARIQELVNEMFPAVSQGWRDSAVGEALKGECMTDAPATGESTP
jgi:hypothetical protein